MSDEESLNGSDESETRIPDVGDTTTVEPTQKQMQPAANNVPYNITDITSDVTSHTSQEAVIDLSNQYIVTLRVSLAIFTISLILVIVFMILYIIRRKQNFRAKREAARRTTTASCIYDNQVDILHGEGADMCAMERAFGTGVLVIGDSPMVQHRLTDARTGTGPSHGSYLSTADSDVETFA